MRSIVRPIALGLVACASVLASASDVKRGPSKAPAKPSLVAAPVAPLGLFGIELGKPLDVPACPRDGNLPLPDVCAIGISAYTMDGLMHTESSLLFGAGKQPSWLLQVSVKMEQDIVKGIVAKTRGLEVQEAARSALLAKFGKPDSDGVDSKYNWRLGTLSSLAMMWRRADGTVSYQGATERIDIGALTIRAHQPVKDDSGALKL